MAGASVSGSAAFDLLVQVSQRLNVKLVEVARRLVDDTLEDPSAS